MSVVTRFAPSPTGYLHVGGLRTALYAYLFAKRNNGTFILRIEDTDQKRLVEGATQHLVDMLQFFDLNYDEGPAKGGANGPYIQSERTEIYRKYAQELLDKDGAYHCFCSAERLEKLREEQQALKQATMYDRHCRKFTKEEAKAKVEAGEAHVIRQKIPLNDTLKFKDLIRGNLRFEGKTIDDQVLVKSDGFPTYHLANVVDDRCMQVTHVIRGEEWLPSTPKHIWLYQAFGWQAPEFAHIPLLLNKDKSKPSKRQGDVSVEAYLEKGYQKEAILNFIAFLGWHPGGDLEDEVFSLKELIDAFSLEKVHKAGAVFEIEKLDWFDWQWRRRKFMQSVKEEALKLDPNVQITNPKKGLEEFNFATAEHQVEFMRIKAGKLMEICDGLDEYKSNAALLERALLTVEDKILKNPKETAQNIDFYYKHPEFDSSLLLNEKMNVDSEIAKKGLEIGINTLSTLNSDASQQEIQQALIEAIQAAGLKNGQVLWPMRSALSGLQFSPGVFELVWAMGLEESLKRLNEAKNKL